MVFQLAPQRMEIPTGSIHVLRQFGAIQLKELNRQFGSMGWLDSGFTSGREESFDASVPEALNHVYSVARRYSVVKRLFWVRLSARTTAQS
jgi:hypothetical protein